MLIYNNLVNLIPIHSYMFTDMFCHDFLFFHQFLQITLLSTIQTCLFLCFASFFNLETERIALLISFRFFAKRFLSSLKSAANHFISAIIKSQCVYFIRIQSIFKPFQDNEALHISLFYSFHILWFRRVVFQFASSLECIASTQQYNHQTSLTFVIKEEVDYLLPLPS